MSCLRTLERGRTSYPEKWALLNYTIHKIMSASLDCTYRLICVYLSIHAKLCHLLGRPSAIQCTRGEIKKLSNPLRYISFILLGMLVHLLLWREMGHKSLLVRIACSTLTWSMAQKSPWRWRRIITMKLYYVRIRMQSRQLNVCHLPCPRQVRFITIFRLTYYTPFLDNARLRCRALSCKCHDLAIKVCT